MIRLTHVFGCFRACVRSTGGAVSIEYALIATLVSVAILGGVEAFSGALSSIYNEVGNELSNAAN